MGKLRLINLDGDVYSCKRCEAHLASMRDVISKDFRSENGEAYLMNKVHKFLRPPYSVNVSHGEEEERLMLSGMHTVVNTYCLGCSCNVGWKYVFAHQSTQKYKEGKYVLDRCKFHSCHVDE